jgi:hypothetical protein
VQTTHKISGDQAQGYATYLTSTSSRGDYYTPGDDEDQAGSRWHGSEQMLASLGLASDRPVTRDELRALMEGKSPADGSELRRVGGNGTRVAGVDMTFSAPKSVSALWAVSSPYERARIEAAPQQGGGRRGGAGRARGRALPHPSARKARVAQGRHAGRRRVPPHASRLTRDQESGGVPDPPLKPALPERADRLVGVAALAALLALGQATRIERRLLAREARLARERAIAAPECAAPASASGRLVRIKAAAASIARLAPR